jgi:chromosome segregation ATPase
MARRLGVPQSEDLQSGVKQSIAEVECELLRRELAEAQQTVRGLRRQLDKALAAVSEAQRAHAKMVATLTETMRENTSLTHERDLWRYRAQRLEAGVSAEPESGQPVIDITALAGQISEDEVNAIRKAIARLHHPDVGGNPERMKAWNAALDRIRQGS